MIVVEPLPSQVDLLRWGVVDGESPAPKVVSVWRRPPPTDRAALVGAVTAAIGDVECFALGAVLEGLVPRLVAVAPAELEVLSFDEQGFAVWLAAEKATPARFDGTPLTRVAVIDVGAEHYVVIQVHHGVLDGYGVVAFMRRIQQRYAATVEGRPQPSERLGDLVGLRAEASAAAAPDPEFWADVLDGLAEPGREIAFTPRVDAHPPIPLEIRFDVGVRDLTGLRDWPGCAIGIVAAYVARYLGSPDAVLGVVATMRQTALEKSTPIQLATVIPTRFRFDESTTALDAAAQLRDWFARAKPRVRAGERPERLLQSSPAGWRTGRTHGPVVNVLPFLSDIPGDVVTAAWGPVNDVLISLAAVADDRIRIDARFNPNLYSEQEMTAHARAVGDLLVAALADPDRPLADHPIPVRQVDGDRIAIPGGYASSARIRADLAAAGLTDVDVRTDPALVVVLPDDGDALARARAVLPPGVRIRTR